MAAALILLAQAFLLVLVEWRLLSHVLPDGLQQLGAAEMFVGFAAAGFVFAAGAWQIFRGRGRWFAWIASFPAVFVDPLWLRIAGALPLLFLVAELVTPWFRSRRGAAPVKLDQIELGARESKRQIVETLFGLAVLLTCALAWRSAPAWMKPAIPGQADGGWVAIAVAIWVSTFVHELGHAAGGAANGFRLVRLAVFPFDLTRMDGRWRLRLSLGMLGGFYLGLPCHVRHLERRYLLLTAAGPATGFVFAAACWLILWTSRGRIDGFWFDAMYTAMGFSMATNLLNLLPFRLGGLTLDGRVIWNCVFRRPEAKALIAVLGCSSSMHSPLRPRDWPDEWVNVLRESLDAGTAPLLSVSAEDRLLASPGDPQALSDLALCATALDEIASGLSDQGARSAFRFHRAWIRCRYGGETAGAEELIAAAGRDLDTGPHEILRLMAALRDAAGDTAGARQLLTEAERALTCRPSRHGIEDADLDGLRRYREEIEARVRDRATRSAALSQA